MDICSIFQIIKYEREENWKGACEYLFNLWKNEKNNVDLLWKTIAEYWLVLVNYENRHSDLKGTLILLTNYGLKHFYYEPQFLSLVGYMITLFPYLFYESSIAEDNKWEEIGKKMLLRACQLEPNNLLFRVLYLGSKSYKEACSKGYNAAKKQLQIQLNTYFPNQTAVGIYFKDVLSI